MATTATPIKTTRSGRPKVPALNKPRILLEQRDKLNAELAAINADDARATAEARLRHLSDVERAAQHVIDEWEGPMRKQALSVALHEGARGVYKGIGLSREAFSRMTAEALGDWPERPVSWDETVVERAKARKVRWYRDAAATLPGIAVKVVTAKAQKDVIQPRRNELVKELFEVHGLKRTEIAEIIGRTPSRISHITKAG
jgi:hypothetical protein